MNELEKYREELENITREMLALLEKRLDLSKKVANYKHQHEMPIFQPEREKLLIEKLAEKGAYALEKEAFLQNLFALSKAVQKEEIEKK